MNVLCLALFASAFNLLLGYAGLLSFGHAAFLGVGRVRHRLRACGRGAPDRARRARRHGGRDAPRARLRRLAIRRSGIYFAMITLGFAQIVYFLVVQMPWTGGEDGLQGIPRGQALGLVALDAPAHDVLLRVRARSSPASGSSTGPSTRRSATCCAPSARTSRARSRSATTSPATSSLAFVLSAGLSGLAGLAEGARPPVRVALRRPLAPLRRGGAHDAARRHGHGARAVRRRAPRRDARELPRGRRARG